MNVLIWLGYVADVAILGTYALLAKRGKALPFHWANALGAIPLVILDVQARLWPVLILGATFGILGWVGVINARRSAQ